LGGWSGIVSSSICLLAVVLSIISQTRYYLASRRYKARFAGSRRGRNALAGDVYSSDGKRAATAAACLFCIALPFVIFQSSKLPAEPIFGLEAYLPSSKANGIGVDLLNHKITLDPRGESDISPALTPSMTSNLLSSPGSDIGTDADDFDLVPGRNPDFFCSANDLVALFSENETVASARLKGKSVLVSGRVDSTGRDQFGDLYLIFKNTDDWELTSVQCFFDEKYDQALKRLNSGDRRISVQGTVTGKHGNIILQDCRLID
jgi:hypothetical protein